MADDPHPSSGYESTSLEEQSYGYRNVRADAKLNAYLRSLAEAVQTTATQPPVPPVLSMPRQSQNMEESVYSNIDSPGVAEEPSRFDGDPPALPPRNFERPNGL